MSRKFQLPHEKLGLSELSYNLAFGHGYNDAYRTGVRSGYGRGTPLRKAYDAGKRAARKI